MPQTSHTLDRLEAAFDDPHAVANPRPLLPATLAQHLMLRELIEGRLDLGAAPGQAWAAGSDCQGWQRLPMEME